MKAIVILYDGKSVSGDVVAEMLRVLSTHQPIGETPGTATLLDDTTVAQALVSIKNTKTVHGVVIPEPVEETPQDKAVIFIGDKYSPFIGLGISSFKKQLTKDFLIAKYSDSIGRASKEQASLIEAMRLLSTESHYELSAALVKKYNFNKTVIKTIIEIFNTYNQ